MRGRDEPQLRLHALDHRRRQPVLDRGRLHLPGLVDGGDRAGIAVDGLLGPDHPARAVTQALDLLLAVDLGHLVFLAPRLRPGPDRALDLLADRHVLAGVHRVLRLAEALALVDPPEQELTEQPGLAQLAGHRPDDRLPDELAGSVDLEHAGRDQLLPPAEADARALRGRPDHLRPQRVDGARMGDGHQPRPDRVLRNAPQALEPGNGPALVARIEPVALRLELGRGRLPLDDPPGGRGPVATQRAIARMPMLGAGVAASGRRRRDPGPRTGRDGSAGDSARSALSPSPLLAPIALVSPDVGGRSPVQS